MAPRNKNMREQLIQAGIDEINCHGVTEFSIRRVATACHVSCAAPYKHFKDKRDFIAAVIDHVNRQWHEREQEVLETCSGNLQEMLVEVSVAYVRFLMDKPHLRSILMLKTDQFDNLYHRTDGQQQSPMQQLQAQYVSQIDLDEATLRRKITLIRSLIYGTVFLLHYREIPYNEETLNNLRRNIDREFNLP